MRPSTVWGQNWVARLWKFSNTFVAFRSEERPLLTRGRERRGALALALHDDRQIQDGLAEVRILGISDGDDLAALHLVDVNAGVGDLTLLGELDRLAETREVHRGEVGVDVLGRDLALTDGLEERGGRVVALGGVDLGKLTRELRLEGLGELLGV